MMNESVPCRRSTPHRDFRRQVKKGRVKVLAPTAAERFRRPQGACRFHGSVSRNLRRKAHQRFTRRDVEFKAAHIRLRQEKEARHRVETELEITHSELRYCLSSLLKSQAQERAWLANELCEGLGQSLTGIKLMIEAALDAARESESGDLRKSLESIVPLMGQSIENLRRFGLELQPPSLEEGGIGAAISWLCRHFSDIHPHIRIRSMISVKDLNDREPFKLYLFKLYLFRILQVALWAVARRGRANRAAVCLRQSPAGFELAIRDNDADPARPPMFAEERVLKEWARRSGGTFRIAFQDQKGMLFQVCWPLAAS